MPHGKRITEADFWARLNRTENGCWEHPLYKGRRYGVVRVNWQQMPAHRFAYELVHGEIAEGLVVCHKCDNPPCCNPDHLWLGTQKDNLADMTRKGRSTKGRAPANKGKSNFGAPTKLTPDAVRTIRDRYTTGKETQRQLAKEFGVDQKMISNIVRRLNWRHI